MWNPFNIFVMFENSILYFGQFNFWNSCSPVFFFFFQIKFASLDLELHTNYIPGALESICDVDQRVSKRTQVIPPLPEDRFLCGFSHIFAGVLDCDVYLNFSVFYFTSSSSSFPFQFPLIFIPFVNIRRLCSWILQLQGMC